jgi:hypothetical protein
MNTLPEKSPTAELTAHAPRTERWLLSFIIPGFGQLAQRRYFTAAGQIGTVLAYGVTAMALGDGRAALFAIAWNIWSAIDAYRHDRP